MPKHTVRAVSATATLDDLRRDPAWHSFRFHDEAYCDDCHMPTATWALADVWVVDFVGTWRQWTCPRCLQALRRSPGVYLEVVGHGFVELAA